MALVMFGKENLRIVISKLTTAIEEALGPMGVAAKVGTVRYDAHEARMTVTLSLVDPSTGKAEDQGELDWKLFAADLGLDASWLGKVYRMNGKTYRIVGLSRNATRYPVILESGGKKYKQSVEMTKWFMKEQGY